MLDAGQRQLVEHLGMLRPHAVVALQQRVRALVVKLTRVHEAEEESDVAATRRQRLVSDDALPQSVDVALTSFLTLKQLNSYCFSYNSWLKVLRYCAYVTRMSTLSQR